MVNVMIMENFCTKIFFRGRSQIHKEKILTGVSLQLPETLEGQGKGVKKKFKYINLLFTGIAHRL